MVPYHDHEITDAHLAVGGCQDHHVGDDGAAAEGVAAPSRLQSDLPRILVLVKIITGRVS